MILLPSVEDVREANTFLQYRSFQPAKAEYLPVLGLPVLADDDSGCNIISMTSWPDSDVSGACRTSPLPPQALLKMDCQGLVARLVMDFALLTTAVEVAGRWRELAERLSRVSRQQMDAYEAHHRDKNGELDSEVNHALRHAGIS